METRTNRLTRQTLRALPGVVLAVAAAVFLLDEPIALAVDEMHRTSRLLGEYASDLPDLLLPAVLLLSSAFWTARFLRVRKGRRDALTDFYRLAAAVLPLAFLAKTVLKFLFGRIETRLWLKSPVPQDLQWFRPGEGHAGFPSGHMTVFTALAVACWIFYPRMGTPCLFLLLLLGAALIGTNYHFLSDVIAGGYAGLAVAGATAAFLVKGTDGRMR